MELYVGIDLGGSHISCWLLDRNGKKYDPFVKIGITGSKITPVKLLSHLTGFVKDKEFVAQGHGGQITAIGIASPGPLEPDKGIIISPPNLPHIRNLEVAKLLQERVGYKTFLVNDADAAVLGEAWLGAAKGFKNVVMLTLGTGVGSGVIVNGHLARGQGMGGEWGHTTLFVPWEERDCSCGRLNCLESYLGTKGLQTTYRNLMKLEPPESGREILAVPSVMNKYCAHLAEGIVNIVNVHHPECIILGGGLATPVMGEKVRLQLKVYRNFKLGGLLEGVEVRTAVNFQAGIIGAAKHAMDSYDSAKFRERCS